MIINNFFFYSSEPEAKLLFNHRTSPSHSTSKLFSPSQQVLDSHTSSPLPSPSSSPSCTDNNNNNIDKFDKTSDKFDKFDNMTKLDKMPTVLHTYSKNQKRKLVDTSSIPSISM